jgi:hypothetical protein
MRVEDGGAMRSLWKIVLPLLLVLPIAAYVVGTLAVADDSPAPRDTIIIQDTGGQGSPRDDGRPRGKKDDDDGQEIRREGDVDDDDIEVVEPEPDDVTHADRDDDHRDRGAGGDGTDDHTLDRSRDD